MQNKIIIAILVTFSLTACLKKADQPAPAAGKMPPAVVLTQKPVAGVMQETISVVGQLTARQQVVVRSELAAQVVAINALDGQQVKKGAKLLTLDAAMLRASLQKVQAQLGLAEQEKQRVDQLFERNVASQYDVDKAEADIISAKANVSLAQTQLQKALIIAPFSGELGIVQVNKGDYVQPGQALVELNNTKQLYVDFPLPETLLGKISKGSEIEFVVPSLAESFSAKVLMVSSAVDAHTGSAMLRAMFDNTNKQLKPGLFIKVQLPVTQKQSVLWLPEKALFISGGKQMVLVNNAGKAKRKAVVVASYQQEKIAISEGIDADDDIVIAGHHKAPFDGMPLMVSPEQAQQKPAN